MRAFIALELPEAFEAEVAALARQLRPLVSGRFMKRETYHLTLAFLGEIDEAEARDTVAVLDAVQSACTSVPLRPDGLGKFGRPSDATLWLGIAPAPELMDLADCVRAELDARGIDYDAKPFRPHITLARRTRLPKGGLPHLVFPQETRASRITLFKSTFAPEGATYKTLYSVNVG